MIIYFFIAFLMVVTAFGYVNHFHDKLKITYLKMILTLMAIAFVLLFMFKYYEIPIHYNRFSLENITNHPVIDSCSTVDIQIRYDYNNNNTDKDSLIGCVFFDYNIGFEPTDSCLFDKSQSQDSICKVFHNKILEFAQRKGYDSIDVDQLHHIVKSTFIHSNRQHLYPFMWSIKYGNNSPSEDINLNNYAIFDYRNLPVAKLFIELYNGEYMGYYSGRQQNGAEWEVYSFSKERYEFKETYAISDYRKPNIIFTGEDISAAIEIISIDFKGINISCLKSIKFSYNAPIEILGLPFEPDQKGLRYIEFTDSAKIESIAKHGLEYHVSFPDMVNTQSVRSVVITAILGLLIGIFFRLLFYLCSNKIHHLWNCRSSKAYYKELFFFLLYVFYMPIKVSGRIIKRIIKRPKSVWKAITHHPAQLFLFFFIVLALIVWWLILKMSTVNYLDIHNVKSSFIFNVKEVYFFIKWYFESIY